MNKSKITIGKIQLNFKKPEDSSANTKESDKNEEAASGKKNFHVFLFD